MTQSDVQDNQKCCYKWLHANDTIAVRSHQRKAISVRPVMIALDSGRCPMAEWIISAIRGVKVLKCTTGPYCIKSGASQRDEHSGLATLVTLRKWTWGSRAVAVFKALTLDA